MTAKMNAQTNHIELVRQSQRGSPEARRELVQVVEPRLAEYVGRMTLDRDVTTDIVQESIAEMLQMLGRTWRWQEPRMMKACQPRAAGYRCAMASYLRDYLPKAAALSCPSSPETYPYLEESWKAGDLWDNPQTAFTDDSVLGSFCFYWNYVAYLSEQDRPFRGPQIDAGRAGCSRLLTSDYFGFNHWRSPDAFGSCERFPHAEVTAETHEAPAYWFKSSGAQPDRADLTIKLQAGFTDGHIESYRPGDTAIVEVADTIDGTAPTFSGAGLGPGLFYIPRTAIPSRP